MNGYFFICFFVGGKELNVVPEVRYLGHIIRNDLSDDDETVHRPIRQVRFMCVQVTPSKTAICLHVFSHVHLCSILYLLLFILYEIKVYFSAA